MTEKNKALFPDPQSIMGSGEPGLPRRGCRGPREKTVLEGPGQAKEVSAEDRVLDLGCEGCVWYHVVMGDLVGPTCFIPSPRHGIGTLESSGSIC